jgi:hypothetical protein
MEPSPEFTEIRESSHHTWVVVNFKAKPNIKTEVTLTHLGWPNDKSWDLFTNISKKRGTWY